MGVSTGPLSCLARSLRYRSPVVTWVPAAHRSQSAGSPPRPGAHLQEPRAARWRHQGRRSARFAFLLVTTQGGSRSGLAIRRGGAPAGSIPRHAVPGAPGRRTGALSCAPHPAASYAGYVVRPLRAPRRGRGAGSLGVRCSYLCPQQSRGGVSWPVLPRAARMAPGRHSRSAAAWPDLPPAGTVARSSGQAIACAGYR